jgi:ABC-type transport system involved in cytochrome c biogenesis permease component
MSALATLTWLSLKLNFRNRMAILYGYLFPLIFLLAFWALYRDDPVPLALHLGQLVTITVLGGACFGLPTTIVSERERGVWRRYALTPAPRWLFVASILVARYVLLLTAALLQIALALAFGMPLPAHPVAFLAAFTVTAIAFMAIGMVIAMLVDNVPAVQALGQCIFLPMLIIGGVAVRLESLPGWAPGNVNDPVQRARNLLLVAAVPDLMQMEEVERFVPRLVFARLQTVIPPRDLPKILYWIAMHPDDGGDGAVHQLQALGLPNPSGPAKAFHAREMLYAFKLLGRLSGNITAPH